MFILGTAIAHRYLMMIITNERIQIKLLRGAAISVSALLWQVECTYGSVAVVRMKLQSRVRIYDGDRF